MSATLLAGALLLGLGGAPHCAAMCGAACGGLTSQGSRQRWLFQAGRLAGYTGAGALAAALAQGLGWAAGQAAALRPAWTLFHLAVLAWGLMLLVLARQPAWAEGAARTAWRRLRPQAGRGAFAAGTLWTLLPCGLLWSALLLASLAGGPAEGAAAMALFAVGSAPGLLAGPWLYRRLRQWAGRFGAGWGVRAGGLLLAAAATAGLWMDLAHRIEQWCA